MKIEIHPETIYIKGGTFQMGSNHDYHDEKPIHTVTLGNFALAKYETTNEQFCAFLNAKGNQTEDGVEWINMNGKYTCPNGYTEKCRIFKSGTSFKVESDFEKHPVIYVSWYGAVAYCEWLSGKTGKQYRLPTEAEWEYAAGGGSLVSPDKRNKWAGTNEEKQLGDYAWYSPNYNGKTHPVGQKKPNELGLYDMSGNVWEWCNDWYDGNYYSESPEKNPQGPQTGALRVLRGGGWYGRAGICRVAYRDFDDPNGCYSDKGFRVTKNNKPTTLIV
jgi:formylglycine-generating enzyme required for sulfatase activity